MSTKHKTPQTLHPSLSSIMKTKPQSAETLQLQTDII